MKSFTLVLSLIIIFNGCSAINGFTDSGQDDFFIVLQFRYLDDTGKYINAEDSRFQELLAYGSTNFITKTSISGKPLKICEIVNSRPVIFSLAHHIKYSDKWRYLDIEPHQFYRYKSDSMPNLRQVFVFEIPRKPEIRSWSAWKKPDYIGDLPETSFVLLGNRTEYLSKIDGPPYFELRYRVVTGTMSGGVLSVIEEK